MRSRTPLVVIVGAVAVVASLTAIPLVFSHVLFKDWISKFETQMKAAGQKLVTLVTNYKKDPKLLDKVMELDDDEAEARKARDRERPARRE